MLCEVALFKDIGFDSEYRVVRDFATEQERLSWFLSNSDAVYSDINYDKLNREFKLEIDYFTAKSYGYVQLAYEVEDTSTFNYIYAFVRDVKVVNDRTVAFLLEEDQWQMNAGVRGMISVEKGFVHRMTIDRDGNRDVYKDIPVTGYKKDTMDTPVVFAETEGKWVAREGTAILNWVVVCYIPRALSGNDWVSMNRLSYIAFPTQKWIPSDGSSTDVDMTLYHDVSNVDTDQWVNLDLWYTYVMKNLHVSSDDIQYITVVSHVGTEDPTYYVDGNGDIQVNRFIVNGNNNWKAEHYSESIGGGVTANIWYMKYDDVPTHNSVARVKFVTPRLTSVISDIWDPVCVRSPFVLRDVYSPNGTYVASVPDSLVAEGTDEPVEGQWLFDTDGVTVRWGVALIPMPSATSFTVIGVFTMADGVSSKSAEDLIAEGISKGTLFEMPGINVDSVSDNWLNYVLTARDSDRKMLTVNAVSSIASSTATGFIGGNAASAAGGALSGAISGVAAAYGQEAKEQGIKNQSNRVTTLGTASSLLCIGSMYYHICISRLNTEERLDLREEIICEGYVLDRMMKGISIYNRNSFDYIECRDAVIRGNMNEDSRKAIADMLSKGLTVNHGSHGIDDIHDNNYEV